MSIKCNFKTFTIALTTLLILLLMWFLLTTDFSLLHRTANTDHYDTFMINVHGIKLDKFGKPHDELLSPSMKHYIKDDMTTAETPHFIFYSKKGPPWHIHADHGQSIHGNQLMTLWDNVQIQQPPGPGSRNTTLLTTKLYLYPDQSYAQTDQPVTIIQPGSIVHGTGLQADLKKGTVKIMSQTQGMYGSGNEIRPKSAPH